MSTQLMCPAFPWFILLFIVMQDLRTRLAGSLLFQKFACQPDRFMYEGARAFGNPSVAGCNLNYIYSPCLHALCIKSKLQLKGPVIPKEFQFFSYCHFSDTHIGSRIKLCHFRIRIGSRIKVPANLASYSFIANIELQIYFACLSVRMLVSKKRQYGLTDRVQFFCGTPRDPREGIQMIQFLKICL